MVIYELLVMTFQLTNIITYNMLRICEMCIHFRGTWIKLELNLRKRLILVSESEIILHNVLFQMIGYMTCDVIQMMYVTCMPPQVLTYKSILIYHIRAIMLKIIDYIKLATFHLNAMKTILCLIE